MNSPYSRNEADILAELEKKIAFLEKRERERRRNTIIAVSAFVLVLIVLAVLYVPKLNALLDGYSKAAAVVEKVSDTIDGVDYEAFDKLVEKLSEMDIEKINSAIDEIYETIDNLSGISGKLIGWLSKSK